MKSRFLPTDDKFDIVPIEQCNDLFQNQIFQSKERAQNNYNAESQILLQQMQSAEDQVLQKALLNLKRSIDDLEVPKAEIIAELKQLKISIKIDKNHPECVEPLQEIVLWIRTALHIYNVVNQMQQFRQIVTNQISQDYIRKLKNFLEDFNLLTKEHKIIETQSPFSFKQQKIAHSKLAKEFDNMLLKTLKLVRAIQNFAQANVLLATNFVDFQYNMGDAIEISQEYMDMIHELVTFYSDIDNNYVDLKEAAEILAQKLFYPNEAKEEINIYNEKVYNITQQFTIFGKSINMNDFKELNAIFIDYQKNHQPIYTIEQLRVDLIFILSDEEEFPTIINGFKRVCVQANVDLQKYEELINNLLSFVSKKRDKKIQTLKDKFLIDQFLKDDKKYWQTFFKLAITSCGNYAKDYEKNSLQPLDVYLKDIQTAFQKLSEINNQQNLQMVYTKLISLFQASFK
ncbi:hypothetical protein pb186bvf_016875 [Paramecium bursaria]